MLKADEARAMMPARQAELILQKIEEKVKRSARTNSNWTRLYDAFSDVLGIEEAASLIRQVVYDRQSPPLWDVVKAELVKAGYTIDTIYEERQFVDMDIKISWEK